MLVSMVVLIVKIHLKKSNIFIFIYLALQATIVTIRELKEYIFNGDSNDTFIVQCYLTHFDLDGPLNQIITKRW